jgi:hypothetical protein
MKELQQKVEKALMNKFNISQINKEDKFNYLFTTIDIDKSNYLKNKYLPNVRHLTRLNLDFDKVEQQINFIMEYLIDWITLILPNKKILNFHFYYFCMDNTIEKELSIELVIKYK